MRMRFGFRMRSGGRVQTPKLVRDAQKINLFALRSLTHNALNNDERATHSRFPLTNVMWRVRGRLTLMLAAAANATATPAPVRHLGLVRKSPSACLSLPRARGGRRRLSNGFRAFQPSSYVTVLGAGSGGEKMVGRCFVAIAPQNKSPIVTEPTLALRALRQASARFRRTAGRTHHFPPAPLHFTSISQATFPFHSFRRPQTTETVKDSGAPKDSRGRDAPHIGQDRQYGRATSSGQDIGNNPRCFARARHQHYGARLRLSPNWVQARCQ
jgi:hypothetical protein